MITSSLAGVLTGPWPRGTRRVAEPFEQLHRAITGDLDSEIDENVVAQTESFGEFVLRALFCLGGLCL